MTDSQHINVFDDIQSLCSDYRRRLRKGERRRIEDYLDSVGDPSREMLFQNLLLIDVDFRRRKQDEPTADEYLQRFPQFSRLIRQAFFESTMMSMEMDAETPREQETIVLGMPAERRLGDYELIRELGRGGFGVVYAAKHLQRGEVVALKTLPTGMAASSHSRDDAERLHKFRHEFRALSEVNHPNLIGMQTLEVDGDQWFFTMDLVEGVDFLEYVRPDGKLDEERLRATLKQLVEGIVALHERGVVHRDLKPNNVLVDAKGHVVLLDFGLVAELQQPTGRTVSLQSQHFAGTPRYAAPEQAAGIRSAAGDWYALGVMLYEALTGEAPFKGTAVQLIVKKQTEDAPQVVGRDGVPRDLAELVDRLLKREPDQRPDATAICEAVGIATDTVSHDSTESSLFSLSAQAETFLVGRESQLAELEQAWLDLRRTNDPVVVFVRGRSGEGKTSLVEKFLEPRRRDRTVLVLSGRCYDRESVPFKAIDCVIDALVAHLRARSTDDVHGLLPSDIHMLAHLFPVLRRVSAIADRTAVSIAGIDSRQIRYRAFAALRELLIVIGQSTPIAMFIDDLQWGDADSATALFELLQPPAAPVVMLLGSYRSDEADESPFLQQWYTSRSQAPAWEQTTSQALPAGSEAEPQEQRVPRREPGNEGHTRTTTGINQLTVEVTSLTEDQCLSLLAARLGLARDVLLQQARDLFQAARGNPYFLEQIIEGFDAEKGQFQAVPLNEIINRKLERLPNDAGALLEAIAIAGQAVKLEEVAGVAGVSTQAFATITHMRSERLVRLIGSSEQRLVDTYHDKIRETVMDGLQDSQRRELHVRYGEYLEKTENITAAKTLDHLAIDPATSEFDPITTDRIYDLAYHFHAANDERGFAYQLMAAEQSFLAYASEDAVEFLKRAEVSLPENVADTVRYRLKERLGTTLSRLGQFEAAFACYDEAITCAPSDLARAVARAGVASIYQSLGQYSSATANYDAALREFGVRRARSFAAIVKAFPLAVRIFLIPPRRNRECPEKDGASVALEHEMAVEMMQYIYDQANTLIDYPYAVLRTGFLSVNVREQDRFVSGLTSFAAHVANSGWPRGGRRLINRTQRLVDEIRDPMTQGLSLYASAVVRYGTRELSISDQEFRRSLPLLVKSGAHMHASICAHLHRHLQAVIGTSGAELASARMVLDLAEGIGDVRGQCWGHYDIASALARAGDIEAAKDRIEVARSFLEKGEMCLTEAIFLGTQGYVYLQASDYDAARASCEESWRVVKTRKLVMEYTLRSLPWLIESITGPDWLTSSNPSTRAHLKRLCRVAQFMYWFYPNLQSPIQRVQGRAFCVLGKRRKAIRCFKRAVKCAESLGTDYDRARSMLDLAAVQEEGRDDMRREAIRLLKQQESVIPYAERWLLGDHYDAECVAPPATAEKSMTHRADRSSC